MRSKRIVQLIILLSALCFVLPTTCAAQNLLIPKVDEYVNTAIKRSRFSGAILIARDGELILNKGYGMANLENDVPNTPRTKFRIASLTKQFTATSILLLQERGQLNVQDSVCKYFAECPAEWKELTIHHLLTHTSGIPTADAMAAPTSSVSVVDIVRHFAKLPLEFKPGARFSYSNANYLLLGYVIEQVSGKPYAAFVRENVTQPLQMLNTGYDDQASIVKERAAGYSVRSDALVNAPYLDMSIPYSAGGLYSTTEDLYRWVQALSSGKILSAKSVAAMFAPGKGGYGYAWYIGEQSGHKYTGHGGWMNGFAGAIARYPDDRLTVIVLSNLDSAPVNTIARTVAAIMLGIGGGTFREQKAVAVDPQVYDAYVGQYELTPNFIVTITREGDKLMGQATGFPKMELFPESEIEFFVKDFDAQILFVPDDRGRVTHSVLTLNGHEAKAPKIK